ncbi:SurA N-terminal domain-containing protein [Pilimelia terevasa]|nr:SurA N-terminal domain-containing protein [Pilimelia terevasa]
MVAVFAVVGIGLTGLAGCRADPDVAAYVGGHRITGAEVARIADEYVNSLPPQNRAQINRGDLRAQVLRLMIVGEAVDAYAKKRQIPVKETPLAEFATAQNLPPQIRLTPLFARFVAGQDALRQAVKPVDPTEEQRREAYRHTTVQGRPVSEPYARLRESFDAKGIGEPLAIRAAVTEAVAEADVTVNPQYGSEFRLPFDIQSAQSYFTVPLGAGVAVADAPADPPAREEPAAGGGHDH